MTTYDFICNHLEKDYPDAIPVMDEYLMSWLEDDEDNWDVNLLGREQCDGRGHHQLHCPEPWGWPD